MRFSWSRGLLSFGMGKAFRFAVPESLGNLGQPLSRNHPFQSKPATAGSMIHDASDSPFRFE